MKTENPDAVLTLQLPREGRFIPIAMTSDRDCLLLFKQTILRDKTREVQRAIDEIQERIAQIELEKTQKVLDMLIPEADKND